jgi:hypothetical protein
MSSPCFIEMPKLNTVLGFRPTDTELKTIEEAERATGRNRSDIMRATFKYGLASVVRAMVAEREAALAAFETSLREDDHSYRTKDPPPKRKAG